MEGMVFELNPWVTSRILAAQKGVKEFQTEGKARAAIRRYVSIQDVF